MQTRQQQDALQAFEHVKQLDDRTKKQIKAARTKNDPKKKQQAEEIRTNYHTIAQRFPFLVRQNGLQQTLAFYAGKATARSSDKKKKQGEGLESTDTSFLENAEKTFLNHISTALDKDKFKHRLHTSDALKELAGIEIAEYMRYTRRCLEAALWYRRFADSLLDDDKEQEGKGE